MRHVFKRLRQVRLSLAVKCQLLFGSAVVIIIAATLYVPWQRMQQLTDQLNEKAAAAVANSVVAEHIQDETAKLNGTLPIGAVLGPPAATVIDGQSYPAAHLVAASAVRSSASSITRFERGALARFLADPDKRFHSVEYPVKEAATTGYRYAEPLPMPAGDSRRD